MRKMSAKAKADAYDGVKAAHDVWWELGHILIGEEAPDAREVIDQSTERYDKHAHLEDGEVHEYRLYRATWAHGGLLAYVHHFKGQRPTVSVDLFENWVRQAQEFPFGIGLGTEIKIACERLQHKRREVLDRKYSK